MDKGIDDIEFGDNLLTHKSAFKKSYRENNIIYHQVSGYFNKDITDILDRQNVTVFDVGANVGLFTLEVLRRTDGKANIYCFEPLPPTYRKLETNLKQLGLSNVHLFNCGLGEDDLTVTFMYNPLTDSMSSRYDMFSAEDNKMAMSAIYNKDIADKFHVKTGVLKYFPRSVTSAIIASVKFLFLSTIGKRTPIECKLTTLSKIIADNRIEKIDLLKIDVEKAELDVLMGISEADWQKINAIVLEVHNIDNREKTILALLNRHGFSRVEVDKQEADQLAFSISGFRSNE